MLEAMNHTELLERVAAALGWKNLVTDANGRTEGRAPDALKHEGRATVPGYTSDIGLAIQACRTLMDTDTRCMMWHAFLYRAVAHDGMSSHGTVVLHASPVQYCHAALEVLEHHRRLCSDQAAVDRVAIAEAPRQTGAHTLARASGAKEKW